ncbi:MAG: transketolase-like TK C-terminal-containing protein, partial [Acidimicrobiia bacterium]
RQLAEPNGSSSYLRLSTRPIDQAPFAAAKDRIGADSLRDAVLRGGYRLRVPRSGEPLIIAASGPVMPEVLRAADMLAEEGFGVTVIDVTSQDLLFREWQRAMTHAARTASIPADTSHLAHLILPEERSAPILTVHDASPHSMAWLGSVFGQRVLPLGVDRFGESGTIAELYKAMGFLPDQLVNAALVAFER